MFCVNCGKTLGPDATSCKHCGAQLGVSRFVGASYTAAQPQSAPEGAPAAAPKYAPYTRTSYTTMEEDAGDDMYSRTTYRPALADEPEPDAPEEAAGEQAAPEESADTAPADAAPDIPEAPEPDTRTDEEISVDSRLEKVKLPGISPSLIERINRVSSGKGEKAEKPVKPEMTDDTPQTDEAPKRFAFSDMLNRLKPHEPDVDERDAEVDIDTDSSDDESTAPAGASLFSKIPNVLRIAIIAAFAIVLLVGGFIWLSLKTGNSAPISGVSSSLYTNGIKLIESRVNDQYRLDVMRLYVDDQTGAAAIAKLAADQSEILALMPGTPLKNDQLFLDTLMSLQSSIENAVALDAISALTSGDVNAPLDEAALEKWTAIQEGLQKLKAADSVETLAAAGSDVVIAIPTEEPDATPTPYPYKILTKGMKDSSAVKKMQNRLYELGFFTDVRDGDFGGVTQTAVKLFQQAAGLSVTGIADVETLNALYDENAPRTGNKVTPAPTITTEQTPVPAPAA